MNELIIDNFAGGGGASTGIELALGRPVDIAINHDKDAIAMHKINHPYTKHYCEDVWQVDPVEVTKGQPVALVWLSPDCTHFSKAKGSAPKSKKIRGLAWLACKWGATVKPRVIILENVEEFKTWGPLDKNGMPIKEFKGKTFNNFVKELRNLGYEVDYKELLACDYGAPTKRKRFFLVARRDGKPIVWPDKTHGTKEQPWRGAWEIIDWTIPMKSIFDRKKPLSEATNKRIARGLKKFVIDNPNPFVVQIGQTGFTVDRSYSLDKPLTTIVSKNEHCLVVPKITPYFIDYHFKNEPSPVTKPFKTITTVRGQYLTAPVLTPMGYPDNEGKRTADIREPLQTIMSGGNKFGLAAASLIQTGYGEAPGQEPRVLDLEKPLNTVVSTCKQALVYAWLVKYYKTGDGADVNDPMPTITQVNKSTLAACTVIKNYGGGYKGAGSGIKEPLGTVTTVDHHSLVCAFLDKYYGGQKVGKELIDPLGTITTKDRFSLITTKINGEDYTIADILMRMFEPRELFNANGFPHDYVIDRGADGKRISKTKQVAKCGNSVPPAFAEALTRAQLPELAYHKIIKSMKEIYANINLLNCGMN